MRHAIPRPTLLLAAAALTICAIAPANAGVHVRNKLVYRVDSVHAKVTGRKLTITADGAVRTGGWQNPHLVARPQHQAEGDTLTVEFRATPPGKGMAVIQALLPVSATVTVKLPRYATTKVDVIAETNHVSAPITDAP